MPRMLLNILSYGRATSDYKTLLWDFISKSNILFPELMVL